MMNETREIDFSRRTCSAEASGATLRRRLARLLPGVAALLLCAAPATADISATFGGGNIEGGRDLDRAEVKLKALRAAGLGMCWLPVSSTDYDVQGTPRLERLDRLVLLVHEHGPRPIFLFEYYTRWNGELGGRDKWDSTGRAFAERFRPNSPWLKSQGVTDWGVVYYSAINEPMWQASNPTPIPPEEYAAALEGLADGVHAVDPALKVSPGG